MKYLNFSDLRAKLGNRARSSIYLDVDAGRLPAPIKLGGRLYWIESAVDDAMTAGADLLGDAERTLKVDAKVTNRAVHLSVAEEKPDRAQVTGLAVDLWGFGAP